VNWKFIKGGKMACNLGLKNNCPDLNCEECPEWEDDEDDTREVKTTCDGCGKNLYEGENFWGNDQIGIYCEQCAEDEIAAWWGII
jgi:hypothetical protein